MQVLIFNFAGRTFRYKPTGLKNGVNELAEALGLINGRLAYPAVLVLNSDNEIIYQNASFLKVPELVEILKAISEYS